MTTPTPSICERLREEAEAFGGSRLDDDPGNVLATLFNEAADLIETQAALLEECEGGLEGARDVLRAARAGKNVCRLIDATLAKLKERRDVHNI